MRHVMWTWPALAVAMTMSGLTPMMETSKEARAAHGRQRNEQVIEVMLEQNGWAAPGLQAKESAKISPRTTMRAITANLN